MSRRFLCAALMLGAAALAHAQGGTAAPAKKELVAKMLQQQQPAFEGAARGLVNNSAAQLMQQAGMVLQTQVPADKREAVGKAIEADIKKYIDETTPLVRERACARWCASAPSSSPRARSARGWRRSSPRTNSSS